MGDDAFPRRYTLFLDFLGASDAARNWPRDRAHQFVQLLISIAQLQSSETILGGTMPDGGYKLNVVPEVTTFSDNAVISYRSSPDDSPQLLESYWTEIVCKDAIRVVSLVAERSLRIGLLVRGGLSFGELFHQRGVVFGEAMVDAYHLESKVASNPRIVLSNSVMSKLTHIKAEEAPYLLKDRDGQWHLNYLGAMVQNAVEATSRSAVDGLHWKEGHSKTIEQEIRAHREAAGDRLKAAAKWEWFSEQFRAATSLIATNP